MLGSYWIHHSRVACCQVAKDRKLIVYFYSAAQMMNPLKFVALLGAALWLFAGANIFRVVVGDRRSRVFVNFLAVWSDLQEPATCCISIRVTKQNTRCTAWAEGSNIFTHLSNYSATGIQLQTILSLWPAVWELLGLKKKPEAGWRCALAVAQLISWRSDYTYYSRDHYTCYSRDLAAS